VRFLVDECTGPAVARWLRSQGHEVFSVYEQARGMHDAKVIAMACSGEWILVTNDKDFGERVFREGQAHRGVVLLRLEDETARNKISVVRELLTSYADRLTDSFAVVSDTHVRFGKAPTA
jgi:predicted nuclease of predicted toxin-antitoxin system